MQSERGTPAIAKTFKFSVWTPPAAEAENPNGASSDRCIEVEKYLFDKIIAKHPTSTIAYHSLQERKAGGNEMTKNVRPGTLTYGEIVDMKLIHEVLDVLRESSLLDSRTRGCFCDLGSGSGKMVIAAALTKQFTRCVGVEIMTSLHEIALTLATEYRSVVGSDASYPSVELFHHNIFSLELFDWTQAGVVYINSTCFDEEMMDRLASIAVDRCLPGAVFVTLSSWFWGRDNIKLVKEIRQEMSWGWADIFIQVRR